MVYLTDHGQLYETNDSDGVQLEGYLSSTLVHYLWLIQLYISEIHA